VDPVNIFKTIGLDIRSAQLEMIEDIVESVKKNKHIVIEAGTGVGKTFAYTLGAWLGLKSLPDTEIKYIVISTNTIALQEQLIKKDLPTIKTMLKEEVKFKIAKGRGRYICHHKLYNQLESNHELEELEEKLSGKWSGDVDELKYQPNYKLWQSINNTSNSCLGRRCEYYKECAFLSARSELKKVNIIVTNHSLLLSHLSLGDSTILPKFSESIYIIDECHHLPAKALSAFAGTSSVLAAQDWINSTDKCINNLKAGVINEIEKVELTETRKQLIIELTQARKFIDQIYAYYGRDAEIYRITSVSDDFLTNASNIKNHALTYNRMFKKIKSRLDEYAGGNDFHIDENFEKQLTSIKFYIDRSDNLFKTWREFQKDEIPPYAKWFEKKDNKTEVEKNNKDDNLLQDYKVCISPISANKILKEAFWDKLENNVILCSATIQSLGSFERFLDDVGLETNTSTKSLPSPFNYPESKLIVPNMKFFPQNKEYHIQESAKIISTYIKDNKKGIMVLFCSLSAMRQTLDLLPASQQNSIIMQGERSKIEIVKAHKKMIDRGLQSIIFGVDSFSEGIDLPGEYLETLIIHKIPFAVPSNPIEQSRNDWLIKQGKNPFIDFSLPIASIRLTQMVGRLIRSESDKGQVIILDKRLFAKKYGQNLLDNLPEFKVEIETNHG